MTPTEADYWRDGIAMSLVDQLPRAVVFEAVRMSETGEQFNAAIWAASRLQEITEMPGKCKGKGRKK